VVDFTTIKAIYNNNGNSLSGTPLEKNFQVLRDTFPAIDGIGMDCEDIYDLPSFLALCRMLIGMKFAITFCPFENPWDNPSFWPAFFAAIEQTNPGVVRLGGCDHEGYSQISHRRIYPSGGLEPRVRRAARVLVWRLSAHGDQVDLVLLERGLSRGRLYLEHGCDSTRWTKSCGLWHGADHSVLRRGDCQRHEKTAAAGKKKGA
jgi:hypothetical protein